MALTIVTEPATEPLLLAEVRAHLRLEPTEGDITTLDTLIKAARQYAEAETGRVLITQTWDWIMDAFPTSDFEVPLPNLQSVTSIKYYDTNGDEQTWAAANYDVDTDSEPGRVSAAYGVSYPSTRVINNAVTVRFVAGYGDADDIPESIKVAMLQLISHWFSHRETVTILSGFNVQPVPQMAEMLLWPYKVPMTW